ncbi:MAG: dTDP-4-dehydrorhamnose 3,5-epimerase family protein [bacterium]|nr:dTDP-4-dehydrorhamnose 3,5-epimerase family protein [bacterium]
MTDNASSDNETIRQSEKIQGIFFIERPTFEDERGFFREYFRLGELEQAVGRSIRLVQANHSRSVKGVLRGIHASKYDKLIYAPRGNVQAAFVDLRKGSESFGKFEWVEMGEANRITVFLPPGVGNSYYVLSEESEYVYLVSEYYDPLLEHTVRWDDPELALPWPDKKPIVSERDSAKAVSLEQYLQLIQK